ncbi:MAG: outer membrane beta-barrel protein [Prevotella sp.]|nr:outer membrane beta-barrel protein [Prevotella sp.]
MKKIAMIVMALVMTVSANAQFEQGKAYVGASLSSFDLSYSGLTEGSIALQGKVGYLLADNLMATAQLSYAKQKDVPAVMSVGAGGRYYIVQNGLYLGASALFKHSKGYDDLLPSVQVGYSFFVSRTVTVEPEIYYEQSFKNHADFSKIGLRIGIGVYLFQDPKQN